MTIKNNTLIQGSGFIAKSFKRYLIKLRRLNVIVYAAGVSNSLSNNKKIFKNEINRFKRFSKLKLKKKVVYISTCSVSDPSRKLNKYIKNKIIIENMIKKNFKEYSIIRFPEIVGRSKNKNTLINYLHQKIKNNHNFNLWNGVVRNIIDVDDAIKLTIVLLEKNKNKNNTFNIMNKRFYKPIEIVKLFEKLLDKKAKFKLINKRFKKWNIKRSNRVKEDKKLNINFDKYYLKRKIYKYYN